ncbi:hypothetical protein [Marimonas arenosa]|uniref:Uncharacterized protein n=1 Tax=Marimonas arenosa TaxID=1795305 RepID=A0AAE4B3S0_9RHOB|nr:hypothetical protein [Marimonas arenosa]MDQ2089480.1 hypothetical protein [Marimonas arenosa]
MKTTFTLLTVSAFAGAAQALTPASIETGPTDPGFTVSPQLKTETAIRSDQTPSWQGGIEMAERDSYEQNEDDHREHGNTDSSSGSDDDGPGHDANDDHGEDHSDDHADDRGEDDHGEGHDGHGEGGGDGEGDGEGDGDGEGEGEGEGEGDGEGGEGDGGDD